jgi:hypothetical protein
MNTALKDSRTVASGWRRGISAGYTRADTPSVPLSSVTRSQVASSLMVQSAAWAAAMSSAVMDEMPSQWTSSAVTRVWNASDDRIAAFEAASWPSTSAVGSASA